MTRNLGFLGGASSVVLMLSAMTASGAVTAEDVWANLRAYAKAFGGDLSATTARTGDTLTINDIVVQFDFPKGSGQATLGLSGLAMLENGDGTVSILYASDPTISFDASVTEEGSGGASVVLRPGTYSVTASGDPGKITYDSRFANVTVDLADLRSDEMPDLTEDTATISLTFDGWSTTSTVTEGALLAVTGQGRMGPYRYSVRAETDEMTLDQSGSGLSNETTYSFALPAEGSDLLNLKAAFDQGMFLEAASQSEGAESRSRTVIDGMIVSDQTSAQGPASGRLRVDGTAISLTGTSEGMEMSILQTGLPFAIAFDIGGITVDFVIPVSANPEPQPFKYAFDLRDVRIGPAIWAQFDPQKLMPRTPGSIAMDLSGNVILDVDILDGQSLKAATEQSTVPVQPVDIQTDSFRLSGLDAIAEATGAFTFDPSDLASFGGLPRPEGQGSLTLTGVNRLLDLMVEIGAISGDEVMGMRMGMAMFTDAVGEDQLRSDLVIDATGSILVNGQRIK